MSSWDFDELDELENVKKGFPDASCDEVTDVTVPLDHRLRIFLVSDLHVDYKQNKEWVQQCIDNLSHEHGGVNYYDCLLLPGDLCTGAGLFEEVMRKLTQAFHLVCFCFGNHEVWTRENEAAKDSLAKLEQIHRLCKELHVYTSPVRIKSAEETIILLPLFLGGDPPHPPPDIGPLFRSLFCGPEKVRAALRVAHVLIWYNP